MGLLDEAIREHLELKRRHGADPTEVARQENEALGPARRAAETAAVAAEDFVFGGDASQGDASPEPEPDPDPVALEPEPEPVDPEPGPEPEPPARSIAPDIVDQPTMEHPAAKPEPLDDDELFALDDEPPATQDGDVLEGTPEFLEETPEHDRLWFEQRPPRDFDFDD